MVAVLVVVAAGGGAIVANAMLSAAYGPEKAVTDYFAAEKSANVSTMMANATFLRGDTAAGSFFDRPGIEAMLKEPQNTDISGVKVRSSRQVDSTTQAVTVSLSWGGKEHSETYTVRQDPTRVHYVFYRSWRVQIPFITLHLTLPNQAGIIQMDGILAPTSSSAIEAIEGFHRVSMSATDFYNADSKFVDGVSDNNPTAQFAPLVSNSAKAAAADSIKQAFATCDSVKYFDCVGHAYKAKAGYQYELPLPGYGKVNATSWSLAWTIDPTDGMSTVVEAAPGEMSASNTCLTTMTVNGSQRYTFRGDWTAELTYSSGSFSSHVLDNCTTARA
jgi:hypothetical protein